MYEGTCKTDEPAARETRGTAPVNAAAANKPHGWRTLAWPLFLLVGTGAAWGATGWTET